jgi:hypothetical protein
MKQPKYLKGQVVEFERLGKRFFGVIDEIGELVSKSKDERMIHGPSDCIENYVFNYTVRGNDNAYIVSEREIKARLIDIESGNY